MRLFVICALSFAFAFAGDGYLQFWRAFGYDDELAQAMAEATDCERLAELLRKRGTDEALFELGRLYYSRGLYRQALAFFQRTEFGGDVRSLYIGLCALVLGEVDTARAYLARISDAHTRAWSSAGLARIDGTFPAAAGDFPYLANFFSAKPGSTQAGGYTLQFGAFVDSSRAEALAQKLRDVGLHPYIVRARVGGRIFFRVRAEHFATRKEAEDAAAALGEQFIYMIVPEGR